MSILIKGMDMPKAGELLCINIYPNGKVCISLDLENKQIATAVQVPKHLRLIDADALYNHMREAHDKWRENPKEYMSINPFTDDETMVLYATTVIEADE